MSLNLAIAKVYGVNSSFYKGNKKEKHTIEGRVVNQSICYSTSFIKEINEHTRAHIDNGIIWLPIREITNTNIQTKVYNMEVEEDNSYTANNAIVHNCQDISIAGKNDGGLYGEKSGLWFEYYRIINELRPKYAIVENVFALRSRGLETILQNFSNIGYDATWTTFDSQYFGTPQRRRRIYILAVRDGIPREADIFRNKGRSTIECRQEVQHIDKSRKWYYKQVIEGWEEVAYFTRQRSDEFKEVGLSSTLLKRDYKDFTDLILMKNKDEERLRKVTPEERLALQGFPIDWFDDLGLSNTDKYKMNGMCTKTVKYIGECLNDFHKKYGK